MKISCLAIEGDWERLGPWLSPAERARLGGLGSRAAARESAHAWVALKQLAGDSGAEVRHRENGRPYLAGAAWEVGLAHTAKFAVAAIDHAPIGIDLEDLHRDIALDPFLDGICSADERRRAEAAVSPELSLHAIAIVFWSLKEAACKWADRPLVPRQCRIQSFDATGQAAVSFADGRPAPSVRWRRARGHVLALATTMGGDSAFPDAFSPRGESNCED